MRRPVSLRPLESLAPALAPPFGGAAKGGDKRAYEKGAALSEQLPFLEWQCVLPKL